MSKLSAITDSLNREFLACELRRTYHAQAQAPARRLLVSGDEATTLAALLETGASEAEVKKNLVGEASLDTVLVVRHQGTDYEGKEEISFASIHLNEGRSTVIRYSTALDTYRKNLAGKSAWRYSPRTEYSEPRLTAFFFRDEFSNPALPDAYAEMVAYADCLVDTNTQKLLAPTNDDAMVELPDNYASLRKTRQTALLDKMRRTRVVGFCSQDQRPRTHARNIALLSAETANWEVFLRAHLDIMNDRFDRMSDGSYAYGQRETYLQELEELPINVPHLLIGIALRLEDAPENHYYGSIARLGRAMVESRQREALLSQLLSMMADGELDDFNRALAYFIAGNYITHLNAGAEKEDAAARYTSAVDDLPAYLISQHRTTGK